MKNKSYTCPRPYSKELILKGEGCGQILDTDVMKMAINRNALQYLWERKMAQPLREIVYKFPTKVNILLAHDPAMVLLGFCPSKLKFYGHKNLNVDIYISFIHNFI